MRDSGYVSLRRRRPTVDDCAQAGFIQVTVVGNYERVLARLFTSSRGRLMYEGDWSFSLLMT